MSRPDPDDAWRRDLRAGIQRAKDLADLPIAEPSEREREALAAVAERFRVRVPASYLERIDWADPNDPIRKQALPNVEELRFLPGEREDPIGDAAHSPVPRLTHRYPSRVLLYPTYVCSMYCRHCFRKEAINEEASGFSMAAMAEAIAYVEAHGELRE